MLYFTWLCWKIGEWYNWIFFIVNWLYIHFRGIKFCSGAHSSSPNWLDFHLETISFRTLTVRTCAEPSVTQCNQKVGSLHEMRNLVNLMRNENEFGDFLESTHMMWWFNKQQARIYPDKNFRVWNLIAKYVVDEHTLKRIICQLKSIWSSRFVFSPQ